MATPVRRVPGQSGVGADEKGGQQAKLGGDCGEGADGQIVGAIGCEREGDRVSHDDLTTARAFGLAARVADLEDQLAKLRHYHFSTLLTLAAMAGGEIRVSNLTIRPPAGWRWRPSWTPKLAIRCLWRRRQPVTSQRPRPFRSRLVVPGVVVLGAGRAGRVGVGRELGAAGGASVGGGVRPRRVRGRTKLMVGPGHGCPRRGEQKIG